MAQIDVMGMLENPLFQMGAGIASGRSPSFIQNVARGSMGALSNLQAMEQQKIDNRLKAGKLAASLVQDPTTIARKIQEAYGLSPGDPGYQQAFERVVKMQTPGGTTQLYSRPPTKAEASAHGIPEPDRLNYQVVKGELKKIPELSTEGRKQDLYRNTFNLAYNNLEDVVKAGEFDTDFSKPIDIVRTTAMKQAFLGGSLSDLGNYSLSPADREFVKNMIKASRGELRLESGAVINEDEKGLFWSEFGPKAGQTKEEFNKNLHSLSNARNLLFGEDPVPYSVTNNTTSSTPTTTTTSAPKSYTLTPKGSTSPITFTEQDLKDTAEIRGISLEEVKRQLGID